MAAKHSQLNLGPMEVPTLDRPQSTSVQSMDRWSELPGVALGRAGISRKAAAVDMALDPSLLSAQLAGKKHLSWLRLGSLPPEFWRELVLLIVEFHGLTVGSNQRDQEDAAVGRCIREAVLRVVGR